MSPNDCEPRQRPETTQGETTCVQTGCGKLYVTVNHDDEGLCEVFARLGKGGGCSHCIVETTGRLVSMALRAGVKPDAIVKQIAGVRCPSPSWHNGSPVVSCVDGIAHVLQAAIPIPSKDQIDTDPTNDKMEVLINEERTAEA